MELSTLFPGVVHLQGSAKYEMSTTTFFAAFENEIQPKYVMWPSTALELGSIVKHLASVAPPVSVAIKGGGHTPWAGAANIAGGILIDLRELKGITLNSNNESVTICAGEHWGAVYSTLQSHRLAVAGGRVSKVGVGGLILGGGLSMFSETRGFVADEVVAFEVVLSSGEAVKASNTENADLFKALKGGSNNFGIVTKFEFPTFEQGKLWGGAIFYPASVWPAVVQKFQDWSTSPDKHGCLIIARVYAEQLDGVCVIPYSTSVLETDPVLQSFAALQPQLFSTIREDTLLGFTDEQASFSTDGARQLYFTTSFAVDVDIMLNAAEIFENALSTLKAIPGFSLSLTLQPLTKQMLQQSHNHPGGNSLGLKPADGPIIIALLNSVHRDQGDDGKVIDAVQGLLKKIEVMVDAHGVALKYRFMNYAYHGTPVFEGYGEESIAHLRAVSKKYDPLQFFQTRVPGGFKVSNLDINSTR